MASMTVERRVTTQEPSDADRRVAEEYARHHARAKATMGREGNWRVEVRASDSPNESIWTVIPIEDVREWHDQQITERRDLANQAPLEWTAALLDPEDSELAANDANSYWKHRRELVELSRMMLKAARNDSEIIGSEHYDTLREVARLQTQPSEKTGPRRGGAREIDPEFIQALRAMYLKKFGVDPFEQGVSVSELIQMMKSGKI